MQRKTRLITGLITFGIGITGIVLSVLDFIKFGFYDEFMQPIVFVVSGVLILSGIFNIKKEKDE